jgi:hypothetical protein
LARNDNQFDFLQRFQVPSQLHPKIGTGCLLPRNTQHFDIEKVLVAQQFPLPIRSGDFRVFLWEVMSISKIAKVNVFAGQKHGRSAISRCVLIVPAET